MSNIEQAHSEIPAHKPSKPRSHKQQTSLQRERQRLNVELLKEEFYLKLLQKLDEIGKKDTPKTELPHTYFEKYSSAYQNFAQSNVSKSEGFSTNVSLSDEYEATLNRLLREKGRTEANK